MVSVAIDEAIVIGRRGRKNTFSYFPLTRYSRQRYRRTIFTTPPIDFEMVAPFPAGNDGLPTFHSVVLLTPDYPAIVVIYL